MPGIANIVHLISRLFSAADCRCHIRLFCWPFFLAHSMRCIVRLGFLCGVVFLTTKSLNTNFFRRINKIRIETKSGDSTRYCVWWCWLECAWTEKDVLAQSTRQWNCFRIYFSVCFLASILVFLIYRKTRRCRHWLSHLEADRRTETACCTSARFFLFFGNETVPKEIAKWLERKWMIFCRIRKWRNFPLSCIASLAAKWFRNCIYFGVLFCFATEYSHNQYSDAVYGKCVCNVCTFNVATHGTQGQSKRKIYSFASCRLRLDNVVWLHWRKATRIRTCEIAKP